MNKPLLIAWDFYGVINDIEPSQLGMALQTLLDSGAEHIIVSHSPHDEIERYLETNELRQYFVAIYGAEWHVVNPGLGKAPALKDYIKQRGVFEAMYMVGDSMNDMSDGKQVKMKTILFDPHQHYRNVEAEVDKIATELSEIINMVQGS